tara:strand:- start:220 stop:567 length:348 start_codon:yes stop_codon:yes gene_type:complete
MATHWPKPGINHVGEFQVSGHTLVLTGSASEPIIRLKYVASEAVFSNADSGDSNVTIYDSAHYGEAFTLKSGATAHFKGKFLTLKLDQNVDALVSITNIPSASYIIPSGSQLKHN